jgi:single-strand DNA-binding protein
MGRIVRDPNVQTTSTGRQKALMTLAVDRMKAKDGSKQADFISLVAWERSAEFADKYLFKGKQILVEGRIQTGSYEKDGRKVYTTDVVVDRFEFTGSRDSADSSRSESGDYAMDEDIPY